MYRTEVEVKSKHYSNKRVNNKSSSPFIEEEEVKLEKKLKELERKRNNSKSEKVPKDKPKEVSEWKHIQNIENNWKPLKSRLIDIGVFDRDKTLIMYSEELEKSISLSLGKDGLSYKDEKIEDFRKQIVELRNELNKAYIRIQALEREAKNENELDKILNSSFDGSEHKSLSFYGLPTKQARSPVVFKWNMTTMKVHKKRFEVSDPSDKFIEKIKYYKYKLRTMRKELEESRSKYNKLNKRTTELYTLNEKLIHALKAQKSFENVHSKKKTIKWRNWGEKLSLSNSNLYSSMDRINIKAENASFLFCSSDIGRYSPTVGVSPRFNNQEEFIYSPKDNKKDQKLGNDDSEFRTKVVNNDLKYVKRPKKRRIEDNRSRTADPFARDQN